MSKATKRTIEVQGAPITVIGVGDGDYISLTEMAKRFGDESLIYNWMRNRNTLEFIGIWEQIHNPNFKGIEFETFRSEAGLNNKPTGSGRVRNKPTGWNKPTGSGRVMLYFLAENLPWGHRSFRPPNTDTEPSLYKSLSLIPVPHARFPT